MCVCGKGGCIMFATMESHAVTMESHVVTMESHVVTMELHVVTMESHAVTMELKVVSIEPHVVTMELKVVAMEPHVVTMGSDVVNMESRIGNYGVAYGNYRVVYGNYGVKCGSYGVVCGPGMYFTQRLRVWNSSMLRMECINNKAWPQRFSILNKCYTAKGVLGNNARNGGTSWITQLEWFFSLAQCWRYKVKMVFTCLTQVSHNHGDQAFTLASARHQVISHESSCDPTDLKLCFDLSWCDIKSHKITILRGPWNHMRSEDHKVTWEFCLL